MCNLIVIINWDILSSEFYRLHAYAGGECRKNLLPLYHTCVKFTGLRNLIGSSAVRTIWLLVDVMLSKMR